MRKSAADKKELSKDDAFMQDLVGAVEEVTRRVLKEELNKELDVRNYATKDCVNKEIESRDYVTKDYLREELIEQRKEYERYAGAWAENLQSQMSAMAEMVAFTAEDMTSIKEWIREDHQRVHSQIDFRLNALEASASKA